MEVDPGKVPVSCVRKQTFQFIHTLCIYIFRGYKIPKTDHIQSLPVNSANRAMTAITIRVSIIRPQDIPGSLSSFCSITGN